VNVPFHIFFFVKLLQSNEHTATSIHHNHIMRKFEAVANIIFVRMVLLTLQKWEVVLQKH